MSLPTETKLNSWRPGAVTTIWCWTHKRLWWWSTLNTTPPSLPPLNNSGSMVSTVESLKFLGTTLSRNLKWERNTVSITERAEQRMFFLQQLKKFNLPQALMIQFYTEIIVVQSILLSSITIWFESSTSREQAKLQRTVRTAERIIVYSLPTLRWELQLQGYKARWQDYSWLLSSWTSPLPASSIWLKIQCHQGKHNKTYQQLFAQSCGTH